MPTKTKTRIDHSIFKSANIFSAETQHLKYRGIETLNSTGMDFTRISSRISRGVKNNKVIKQTMKIGHIVPYQTGEIICICPQNGKKRLT